MPRSPDKFVETRFCGYSYRDLRRLERERDVCRLALNQIVGVRLDKKPPRDIRGARKIAIEALFASSQEHSDG